MLLLGVGACATAGEDGVVRPDTGRADTSSTGESAVDGAVDSTPPKPDTSVDAASDSTSSDTGGAVDAVDAADDATDAADAPAESGDTGSVFNVVQNLTAGTYHTCARLTDGSAKCWGYNFYGQLGDGTTTAASTPQTVAGLVTGTVTALRLSAGGSHTCARLSDDTVKCWGSGSNGQIGDGTLTTHPTPTSPTLLTKVVEIAAGQDFNCARLSDGTVKCWGDNLYGQLGLGTTIDRSVPTALTLTNVAQVACGTRNACARLATGTVMCWGDNLYGQIGDGTTIDRPSPRAVTGVTGATDIAVGSNHTCALIGSGPGSSVKCWGNNSRGEIGDGTSTQRAIPVTVPLLTNVVELSSGDMHTCARLTDGTLKCWGYNLYGQLGDGTTTQRNTPTVVPGVTGALGFDLGRYHTCTRITGNTALCWGYNTYGGLGDGTKLSKSSPVSVVP